MISFFKEKPKDEFLEMTITETSVKIHPIKTKTYSKYLFIPLVIFLLYSSSESGCKCAPDVQPPKTINNKNWKEVKIRLDRIGNEFQVNSSSTIQVKTIDVETKNFANSFSLKDNPEYFNKRLELSFLEKKFTYKGKIYRGGIFLIPENKQYLVVNVLDKEDYLLGVVPSEMPASWHIDALKAQAVAARTYAIYYIENPLHKEFHLEADVSSQVYTGTSKETSLSSMAVQETKGEVMLYNEFPIKAYFHSNSGGHTETPENVWGDKLEYFQSIPSEYCNKNGGYTWELFLSQTEINDKLKNEGVGKINDIILKEKTESGRTNQIEIVGEKKSVQLKGNDFRKLFGFGRIKSLLFEMTKEVNGYQFKGKGFGHGVGMSQWGAFHMATANLSYKQILNFYYPKGIITKVEVE
ncbi:MAG: SpoIID/LytB domain-containing protein [Leptospiraceae bacterium]|nr:SpoIID/LytB domain-containing protein [Leptospiraceae bacterium]